ncbi:MAG: hypothetical protein CMJ75_04045 [Planctomycetaceae bacterium]|nr:hypothetical protein [Planctomycetaceae bacterium]
MLAMGLTVLLDVCGGGTTWATGVRLMGDRILLETDHVTYAVGRDGLNKSLRDTRTGKEFLDKQGVPFMFVARDGQWTPSTALDWVGGTLRISFADTGIRARLHPRVFANYLTFELVSINDQRVSEIQLIRLPLTITQSIGSNLVHCRNSHHAVALIPLNMETHCYVAPLPRPAEGQPPPAMVYGGARGHVGPKDGQHPVLIAHADGRLRLEGAKVAIAGCASGNLLDVIEQIEIDNGLPHPTIDGVWARRSPELMKSLLYTDISEATADEVIAYAKAGGFTTVHINRPVWCASNGSYLINRVNFPNGEAGLLDVSRKIHAAGLKFGMHNWEMVIHKHDPLVKPVPARGFLMYPDRRRILAADIGPDDTFIPTTTTPNGLLSGGDKAVHYGRDLRIGDEIIIYGDLKRTKPYGFTGCLRGALGTRRAGHTQGNAIDNFAEFYWSYYKPDLESELFDHIMRAEAALLEKFQVDYYYPDGAGENTNQYPSVLPDWYIRGLSTVKRFHYTSREVRFAHGATSNFAWHVLTQGNHSDSVQQGVMEHFNRSLAEAAHFRADLQPIDLGWLGYFTHNVTGLATRPREMAYAWSKALAYEAPISLSTDKARLDGNGRTAEIFAMIRQWEKLKVAGYFPQSIRDQLKQLNREFVLENTSAQHWQIRPVTYAPEHYVADTDGVQNTWVFHNQDAAQPLRVAIEPMPRLADYGDPQNIAILAPGPLQLATTGAGPMWGPRAAAGMELKLQVAAEPAPGGGKSFQVTAANKGKQPQGWACAEVILNRKLKLAGHRALGAWVLGDGSGAYLHFTLESGRRSARDYYTRLDFRGWKYVQMYESAGGEIYDFQFPFSNYWALGIMDYEAVDRVYVFLTNLPPGTTSAAGFGRLEALRETPLPVVNPGVTVRGERIVFPVTLQPGWYLEYAGGDLVRVFDPNGFTKAEVRPDGMAPTIGNGNNAVSFFCAGGSTRGQTAKVRFVTRGEPLR